MSSRAERWVRGVVRRPMGMAAGRRLTPSEKLVLRVLASFYRDELQCAYASMRDYTEACGLASERHMRCVIARLEEAGLVLRSAMKRGRDGSQTTSLLEFPLMGFAAERMVCPEAEWPMRKAAWARVEAQRTEFFRDGRRPMGLAAVQMVLREPGPPVDCQPGAPVDCQPPSELYEELYLEHEPPMPPLAAVECADRVCLVKAKAKAKASAKAKAKASAKATTLPPQAASGAQDGVGSAGASSGARVRARDLPTVEALDGEAAAWHAETTRVMHAIGIVNESLRPHLLRAMQLEAERSRCTIAAVGLLAEQRWHEYTNPKYVRSFYPRPRDFFRDGWWVQTGRWKLDSGWLNDMRRVNRSFPGGNWN